MRVIKGWLALVVLGSISGCFASEAASPSSEADDGLPDASKIFAAVSELRRLPKQEQPPVRFLKHRAYLEASQRVESR